MRNTARPRVGIGPEDIGIRLLVTLPYHFPRESGDHSYLAQVVRFELLDDGQLGVAVQLLSSVGGPQ